MATLRTALRGRARHTLRRWRDAALARMGLGQVRRGSWLRRTGGALEHAQRIPPAGSATASVTGAPSSDGRRIVTLPASPFREAAFASGVAVEGHQLDHLG